MQLTTTERNARLANLVAAMGSGGSLEVYTGSSPGVGNSATGTLLSTLTAAAFGSVSAGAVSVTATADSSAAASGTPGYVRFLTSGAVAVDDFTAGVGSGEFDFSATIRLGGTVTMNSFTLTEGNA